MRNYILTYDLFVMIENHQRLIAFVKSNKHIEQWAQPFLGTILIKSNADRSTLAESLTEYFGQAQHMLAPIENAETTGILPQHVWDWLNHRPENNAFRSLLGLSLDSEFFKDSASPPPPSKS